MSFYAKTLDPDLCRLAVASPRWTKKIIITDSNCHHWLASDNFAIVVKSDFFGTATQTATPYRIAWTAAKGNPPSDAAFMRSCTNLRCVNPDHLYLATWPEAMKHKLWSSIRIKVEAHGQDSV